jgi:protein-S-isoprenylcysteine O-methyltransferase Ste14
LIIPVVTLAVVTYAWPFESLEFHEVWEIRCLILSFFGLAIRCIATGHVPDSSMPIKPRSHANTLNTTGLYSVVRHPRYLGDYLIGLGTVLIPFVWWLVIGYTLAFWFYYQRLIATEEAGLRTRYGKTFDHWKSATPALIPRFSQWRPAKCPFSFRAALKQEHSGLLVVIALHSSVEWLEHWFLERRILLEVFWIVLALVGLATYILIRHLGKYTRVLETSRSTSG